MEMKNICGKIPLELHAKVRREIEQREISTQEFLQQVIEEHFMEKGVEQMAARTIAVQVTEELFGRLKAAVAWKGCKQKDFLIGIVEKGIAEIEDEQKRVRLEKEALARQQEELQTDGEDDTEEETSGETEGTENSEAEVAPEETETVGDDQNGLTLEEAEAAEEAEAETEATEETETEPEKTGEGETELTGMGAAEEAAEDETIA